MTLNIILKIILRINLTFFLNSTIKLIFIFLNLLDFFVYSKILIFIQISL